ncbi:MAG: hypothetical protein MIO92_01100 [Methanosarcinaceae archaeon]|nr:hypothetical protein [Methanosarcinaceae archaeon]
MSPQSKNLTEKRQYWKSHILRWQESGLTQIEYCRKSELHERVFGYWKRKLVSSKDNNSFVEIPARTGVNPSSRIIELRIPDGTILRCSEDIRAINLQNILRALRG